jgi:hypothetical protein
MDKKELVLEYLSEKHQLENANLSDRSIEAISNTYGFALWKLDKTIEKLWIQVITEFIERGLDSQKENDK